MAIFQFQNKRRLCDFEMNNLSNIHVNTVILWAPLIFIKISWCNKAFNEFNFQVICILFWNTQNECKGPSPITLFKEKLETIKTELFDSKCRE